MDSVLKMDKVILIIHEVRCDAPYTPGPCTTGKSYRAPQWAVWACRRSTAPSPNPC